ncbi:MAG: tetratricopeptide repeat protein, partial [Gemmatimonadales bacterium]
RRRRLAAEFAARVTAARSHGGATNGTPVTAPADVDARQALPFELVDVSGNGADGSHAADGAPLATDVAAGTPPAPAPVTTSEPTPPPPDPAEDLLYRAAREATDRGDLDRAVGVYRELVQRNPHHLAARNGLALVQATLGRYGEAERGLRTIVEMDPTNADAHLNLGLVVSRKGRWVDAIPHLRRAIELDAGREVAHFYLGEALNHVDDLPGALQAYQRAAELRPNNSKALYGLGIILDRMNRPDDAAQMYRRSRELAGR